jgi:threonine dehydratase
MVRLEDVRAARERIRGRVVLTPCTPSEAFGEMFGGKAFFKFENLQRTGSFKERGALNCMLGLSPEERERGVIAASAGNHAQGVAFHARRLGIGATIVMPERTPLTKVSNTERYGARVVLHGGVYDEAMAEANRIRGEEGQVLIHPFDMDAVIAGQGSIGLELLEQCPEMDVVVVPVGGGGLISGIALAIKEVRPEVRVVGVESAVLPAALRAREAHGLVTIDPADTIADGIAVRVPIAATLTHLRTCCDDVVAVSEARIFEAMRLIHHHLGIAVEPSGAVGVAAILDDPERFAGRRVATILCGGNLSPAMRERLLAA